MKIPIELTTAKHATDWCLIELNGNLYMPKADGSSSSGNHSGKEGQLLQIVPSPVTGSKAETTITPTELGRISFPSSGAAMLTIGSHELTGKKKKLPKKIAVLRKVRNVSGSKKSKKSEKGAVKVPGTTKYVMEGCIEEKWVFEDYPRLIIRKR